MLLLLQLAQQLAVMIMPACPELGHDHVKGWGKSMQPWDICNGLHYHRHAHSNCCSGCAMACGCKG
jgi:hypothetical protein